VPAGGASGALLAKSSAADYATTWIPNTAKPATPPWIVGWATLPYVTSVGNASIPITLQGAPFRVPNTVTTSQVAFYIGTAVAGTTLDLWIYNDNGAGKPSTVVCYGGNSTSAGAGNWINRTWVDAGTGIVITPTLTGGSLYWLVWKTSHASSQANVACGTFPVTWVASNFYTNYAPPVYSNRTIGTISGTASVPADLSSQTLTQGPNQNVPMIVFQVTAASNTT
jgi:hypothetical protein